MKRFLLIIFLIFTLSIGASAASFVDMDEINHQSAVIMLTDLGVLSGYEDGTFRPRNTMNRGEIAKVMTILSTDEIPITEGLTFEDTETNWARDYIEYCAELGVISGSDGLFRPNDNVTVRELAKMLLVIIGEKEEDFTGEYWAENVEEKANEYGLFAGFTSDLSRYVTREDAALIINNALQCDIILGYEEDGVPIYNLDEMRNPKSMLETRFGAVLVQGVVEANSVYNLWTEDGALESNHIHISGYNKDFRVSNEISTNNDLLGHKITIYAIFRTDYNRIVGSVDTYYEETTIPLDFYEDFAFFIENGILTMEDDTNIYVNFEKMTQKEAELLINSTTSVVAIDHNGDNLLEYVFYTVVPQVEDEPEYTEDKLFVQEITNDIFKEIDE